MSTDNMGLNPPEELEQNPTCKSYLQVGLEGSRSVGETDKQKQRIGI